MIVKNFAKETGEGKARRTNLLKDCFVLLDTLVCYLEQSVLSSRTAEPERSCFCRNHNVYKISPYGRKRQSSNAEMAARRHHL
jgi:hypothetical protein